MAGSPHHADVFSHLPVQVMHELDTPPVAALLDRLIASGWSSGQLRHRVGGHLGGEGTGGSPDQIASQLLDRLLALGATAPAPVLSAVPHCSLCDGAGALPVTGDVHLCRRCVALLASGRARLADTG